MTSTVHKLTVVYINPKAFGSGDVRLVSDSITYSLLASTMPSYMLLLLLGAALSLCAEAPQPDNSVKQSIHDTQPSESAFFTVNNVTRAYGLNFENLAVRSNGQILVTTTRPNASIYQVDPLHILPLTLIHTIPGIDGTCGIVESKTDDIFYVVSGNISFQDPSIRYPGSYAIVELDVRNMSVLPNKTLSRQPDTRRVANLTSASLLNGAALAGPNSSQLLVADTFAGLIWNVNTTSGAVGVTLNDTTTKGPGTSRAAIAGVNGIKVANGSMYWTVTAASSVYSLPVDSSGNVRAGLKPTLLASNVSCDDLLVDSGGTIYVAGPLDVITRITRDGQKQIIAGTFNSTSSVLVGPTALRFGRLASDRYSMYITTNGGVTDNNPNADGVSRIDFGADVHA